MRKVWTKETEKILIDNYPNKTMNELLILLPTFTKDQIRNKAKKMGLQRRKESYSVHLWTQEEDKIIKSAFETKTAEEIAELFPGVTVSQVRNRIHRLGLKKLATWTQEEEKYLKENYNKKEISEMIEEKLHSFSPEQINKKMRRLGLLEKKVMYWTDEEVEILKRYYRLHPNDFIINNYLPHRTKEQLKTKAKSLGIKKDKVIIYKAMLEANKSRPDVWTEEEKKILAEKYGTMNNKILQREYLPRKTLHAIRAKAGQLGIRNKTRQYFTWQQESFHVDEKDITSITFKFQKEPVK